MKYDTDAQKLTMTDEWGNEAEYSYNIEDWDYFDFKKDLLNAIEILLKKTIVDTMYHIIND